MATQTVTRTTCDRCPRVIEEVDAVASAAATAQRKGKPLVYIEENGEEILRLDDLCPKCTTRVDHLLKQLRLVKEDEDLIEEKTVSDDKKADAKDSPRKDPKKDSKKDKGGESAAAPPA